MDSGSGSSRQGLLTLLWVVLVVFTSIGLGRFGFSMLLPSMQQAMALTNVEGGQLQSWNAMGYLLFVVPAGILATRYGPSIVIRCALALLALSMVANGLFASFPVACAARFVGGVGGAAANVPAMGLLAAWFTGRRRGLAAGCAVGGSSLGLAATGFAVPRILQHVGADGWCVSWYVFAGTTAFVCVLCCLFLRDRPRSVAAAQVGASTAQTLPWTRALSSPLLWQVALAYFAFGFSYSIYATFFVKHLIQDIGMTQAVAGSVWTRIGLASIVSGFIWGSFSDRWGRRLALTVVFGLQGAAFLSASFRGGDATVFVSGLLFALTAWSIPAVVSALCGDAFGARLAPTALGLATVVFGIGQVLGPAVGGFLADTSGSMATAFTCAGVVALLLGAGGSLFLPRMTGGGQSDPAVEAQADVAAT